MEKSLKFDTLFVHGGPGNNLCVEHKLFSKKYSNVKFWNQPPSSTFLESAIRLEGIISDLYLSTQKKITVVGHSFGGLLIRKALENQFSRVNKIVLINSSYRPFNCFINLSIKLGLESPNRINELDKLVIKEKMQFIFKLASHKDFPESYWYNRSNFEKFSLLAADCPPFDFATFSKVFEDYLACSSVIFNNNFTWDGRVIHFYSKDDPLITRKDIEPWVQHYPKIQEVELIKSGHLSHIEDLGISDRIFLS